MNIGKEETQTENQSVHSIDVLLKQTKNQVINSVCYDLDCLCNNLEDAMYQDIRGTKMEADCQMWNRAIKQSVEQIQAIIQRYKQTYNFVKHEGDCPGECPICELHGNLKSLK